MTLRSIALFFAVAGAVGAVVVGLSARGNAVNAQRASALVERVHRHVDRLNALEWRIIAEREVAPDVRRELRDALADASRDMAAFKALDRSGSVALAQSFRRYTSALDEELRLLGAGKFQAARTFDEERVDPGFEALEEVLKEEVGRYEAVARSADGRADTASLVAFVLGSAVVLLIALFAFKLQVDRRALRIERHGAQKLEATNRQLAEQASELMMILSERDHAEQALRESVAELRQSQKMEAIGQLAGGVAHDFNNLLMVISSYSSELEHGAHNPAVHEAAHEIGRAAERAAGLTRQLLTFSRKNADNPQVVHVNELIRNLERILRRLLNSRIEFSLDLADELGPVLIDASLLEQVLLNLVLNANDAMPDGGRLVLKTRMEDVDDLRARRNGVASGQHVTISVCDAGGGIDDTIQERIFEPFFTTKAAGFGTGLGLATSFGIVKQSGGCIELDSTLGHGSTFTVVLPVTSARADTTVSMQSEPAVRSDARLLLVDDDAVIRRVVTEMLETSGYHVVAVEDGAAAIEIAGAQRVDLLITDIQMPKMSGTALAAKFLEQHPDVPVLFISGYPADAGQSEHERLQKPFTRDTLIRKVELLLAPAASTSLPAVQAGV